MIAAPQKQEAQVLEVAMAHILNDEREKAVEVIDEQYPYVEVTKRSDFSKREKMEVWLRDGFIDRYSGERLFFPPYLEILQAECPEAFPWRHIANWRQFPSIDHVVPVARGGAHEMENWITTSMARNLQKGSQTTEEVGWEIHEPGSLEDWDGGLAQYVEYVETRRPELLRSEWYGVAKGRHRCI